MKILTICPSKYPEKLSKMMDSFLVTRSKYTQIIVNYEEKSITKIFNEVFEANPNYDFYHLTNDDVIYNTPLWDLALANKGKISYGSDGIQNENLPTFPMIDGDIVRALGWLQMPTLNRYCGDVVLNVIGKQCGILNYFPDIKIEHQWYESQVDKDIHIADMAAFAKWLPFSFRDMEKVRKVLNG
jgi:hypothetical protein